MSGAPAVGEAIGIATGGKPVPGDLLESAFGEIADGLASEVQIAGLLVALRTRGETPEEITAAARALRARSTGAGLVLDLDPRTVDTCGTGGDASGTFNISTTVAFVVAGAGVPVAKHGNRAATSRSGSFDVLETLGVGIELPVARSAELLREIGIGTFFARAAHPAMRHVAPVRAALGVRTLMNCLGPLLNPVGAKRQLVGVYDGSLVRPLCEALVGLGADRAMVVHGEDGLDEFTTTGASRVAFAADGDIREFEVTPESVGLARASASDLAGGDAEENAAILRAVLDGEAGPRRDIVVLNAGAALQVAGEAGDLRAGVDLAAQSIDSGAAKAKLAALVEASS